MGKLADCERIVQEAVAGLGGLDVIISNAVGATVRIFGPRDGEGTSETAPLWPDLTYKRAGQNTRNSEILTLSLKPIGTKYASKFRLRDAIS